MEGTHAPIAKGGFLESIESKIDGGFLESLSPSYLFGVKYLRRQGRSDPEALANEFFFLLCEK